MIRDRSLNVPKMSIESRPRDDDDDDASPPRSKTQRRQRRKGERHDSSDSDASPPRRRHDSSGKNIDKFQSAAWFALVTSVGQNKMNGVVSELGWVELDLRCSTILLGQ